MRHNAFGKESLTTDSIRAPRVSLLHTVGKVLITITALAGFETQQNGWCGDRFFRGTISPYGNAPVTNQVLEVDEDEFPGNPDDDFSPAPDRFRFHDPARIRPTPALPRERRVPERDRDQLWSESDRIQRKLTSRYHNPVIVHLVREMSAEQGLALYLEVSRLIDARHLNPSSYETRGAQTLKSLRQATRNRAFRRASGLSGESAACESVIREIEERVDDRALDASESYELLRRIMQIAQRDGGMLPGSVALEFVFGAIDSLDRYSGFVPSTAQGNPLAQLEGHVVGVGVEIEPHHDGMRIVKALPRTPAAEAGLRVGDIIEAIDGREMAGAALEDAVSGIAGPAESRVTLRIRRGDRVAEFTLVRRQIELRSISEAMIAEQGVGYVKLEKFAETSTEELDRALFDLNRRGMQSLIVDLRGNPGGLLTTAIGVSSRFIGCGPIVSTRGRNDADNTVAYPHRGFASTIPLVVLVDEESASASEIFAAAIQDDDRGLIVGRRTYGKGTVQTHFPLQSVSGDLVLTTARFLSPKGRLIEEEGVEPDVDVPTGRYGRAAAPNLPASILRTKNLRAWDRDIAAAIDAATSEKAFEMARSTRRCGVGLAAFPPARVVETTPARFEADVIRASAERLVVVDFWATWCGGCRQLTPLLETLAAEFNGRFLLVKVNTEENPELAEAYGVQSVPYLVAFRDGRPRGNLSGVHSEPELREWLNTLLSSQAAELKERSALSAIVPKAARVAWFDASAVEPENLLETLRSVIETWRQQERNVLAFIIRAIELYFAPQPLASQPSRVNEHASPIIRDSTHELSGARRPLGFLSDSPSVRGPVVHAGLIPSTARPGDIVTLSVTVSLPPGTHAYSTDPIVPIARRIDVTDEVGLKPKGEFEADRPPAIVTCHGKDIETIDGCVTWLRQYELIDRPERVRVDGSISLAYCDSINCHPFSQKIRAHLVKSGAPNGKTSDSAAGSDGFRLIKNPTSLGGQPGPATLTFVLSPSNPKPGDKVTLTITMHLDDRWHTYSTTQNDEPGSTPTSIDLTKAKNLQPIGDRFKPDRAPELWAKQANNLLVQEVYQGQVAWTRQFQLEPKAGDDGFGIKGSIRYGVCNEATCQPPKSVEFSLGDLDGASAGEPPKPLPDDAPPQVSDAISVPDGGLWFYLCTAFLGGLIQNVMPCVLPVLAIKVLSFVQQGGESRSRILLLKVAYTVGVLAVFLTLATLAVSMQIGWGGLFQQTRFNIVMACVIFAMGLSLMGVFEIPVPGMFRSAAGRSHSQGILGAFLSGILATVLATPCIGPFMGPALFWAARQPAHVAYLICSAMGLGMASPYLVLGVFPKLVKWLPKPGPWTVRLKEFAGFVLSASVIFIIYYMDEKYTVSVLVMLLGVALGLWMIGNLYDINSHIRYKATVRVAAVVLTGLICWIGYGLSGENRYELPWQQFSEARLTAIMKQKKTVLVDFTAKWCINCQVNGRCALNTRDTLQLVSEHDVVPLLADFTDESDEIKQWLLKFRQDGVPLTVIFPAARQNEPIVLSGVYTKGTLLKKLQEAVKTASPIARSETVSTIVR